MTLVALHDGSISSVFFPVQAGAGAGAASGAGATSPIPPSPSQTPSSGTDLKGDLVCLWPLFCYLHSFGVVSM